MKYYFSHFQHFVQSLLADVPKYQNWTQRILMCLEYMNLPHINNVQEKWKYLKILLHWCNTSSQQKHGMRCGNKNIQLPGKQMLNFEDNLTNFSLLLIQRSSKSMLLHDHLPYPEWEITIYNNDRIITTPTWSVILFLLSSSSHPFELCSQPCQ